MCQDYIGCTEFPVQFKEILLGARDQNPDVTQYSTGRTSKNHEDVGIKLKNHGIKMFMSESTLYTVNLWWHLYKSQVTKQVKKKKSSSIW